MQLANQILKRFRLIYFSRGLYYRAKQVPAEGGQFFINGTKVFLSGEHYLSMLEEIVFYDSYQLHKVKGNIKSIVDIGANIGVFTLFAGIKFAKASIHAYEPNTDIHIQSMYNLKSINNFTLYSAAVTRTSGHSSLFYNDDHTSSSLLNNNSSINNQTICETISFTEVVDRCGGNIDLLKLDCEGSEYQIFKSHKIVNVKYITGELHTTTDYSPLDGINALIAKGFTVEYYPFSDSKAGIFFAKNSNKMV